MLVLTRKLMERLYIGNDICVTVVRLEGGQVRLGIDAPREIAVVRAELLGGQGPDATGSGSEPNPDAPKGAKPVRIPPTWTLGIDSRRRGPSR